MDDFWAPGRVALVRHCRNGGVRAVRPCVVVADGPDETLLWLPRDTPVRVPLFLDGRPVREVPLGQRFTRPWRTTPGRWTGTSLLKSVRPGVWHSLYWFFEADGRFRNWYVNVESPPVRWDDSRGGTGPVGFDSDDLELDVVVSPAGEARIKDEDEAEAAVLAGDVHPVVAERVWREARAAVAAAAARRPPFDGHLTDFRPDPAWPRPDVPPGWDRPVAAPPATALLAAELGPVELPGVAVSGADLPDTDEPRPRASGPVAPGAEGARGGAPGAGTPAGEPTAPVGGTDSVHRGGSGRMGG